MAAETANRAFFDGDQRLMLGGKAQDQVAIQRLGETGIGDGGLDALGGQRLGGFLDFGETCAKGQDGDALAFLNHPALANFQNLALFRHLDAGALATGIAEGNRPAVMGSGGGDHMHQLGLIRGGHHGKARQVREIGNVVAARMGRPVCPDKPGAVDGEPHRQALDRHVMHDLIVAALEESGIKRAKGFHPARCQRGGKGHTVLFCNTHVETPAGKTFGKEVEPRAIRHRRRHRADLVIGGGQLDEVLSKYLGIGRRIRRCLGLFTGHHVELGGRMALVAGLFRRAITLALAGQCMDQDRPPRTCFDHPQDRQKLVHVMPVNRADIGKPKFLEKRAAHRHALEHFLGALGAFPERSGKQ